MKNKFYTIAISMILMLGCKNTKTMDEKENYPYSATVTSVKNYPIVVHTGYLATKETFITGFENAGIEDSGWHTDGGDMGSGGKIIPTLISLTWVSYAEKKFWELKESPLPKDVILAHFKKGFYNYNRVTKGLDHQTYKHITTAVAPGGVVVVFLTADFHRVEIARFQAETTHVDVNDFYDNPDGDNEKQFFDWWFKHSVPQDLQTKIEKDGIPFGLWDRYREKYNWRYTVKFYKEDRFTDVRTTYFNGEENYVFENELNEKLFYKRALPEISDIGFSKYWYEVNFDWEELEAAFKKIIKEDKNAQIEIVAKVGFEYKEVTFSVTYKDIIIPLTKTTGKMWSNLDDNGN
jgi:hypothetical protein